MKYGETLRQRSIPAWSHHNIDYDDIKHLIKDRTTPGDGKTISIPGCGDDKLKAFENELFAILADQHSRIDLFVKSKAGEIQRRLDHAKRQLRQLRVRHAAADGRIPVSRLERYSKLEGDVMKIGDEIKSLARYASTQRTAFRKLLKKYKKWTGSTDLQRRFQDEILDDSKSFTNLELGFLLDQYSETLFDIRSLYESRIQQALGSNGSRSANDPVPGSSVLSQLQSAVESGDVKDFDCAFASVPIGERGLCSSYFVHPDNIVELQVQLLHHLRYFSQDRKQNPKSRPATRTNSSGSGNADASRPNYGCLIADRLERFVQEQSRLTVDDRERNPGSTPQKAKFCARWQDDEQATLSARAHGKVFRHARVKRKHLPALFEKDDDDSVRTNSPGAAPASQEVQAVRSMLVKDNDAVPLCTMTASRSRFVGLGMSSKSVVVAVLDTDITIQSSEPDSAPEEFPFACLWVRQEGLGNTELSKMLDESHLVERVRGFSMEYHAVWTTHKESIIAAPFWLELLSTDIRKLPPPMTKRSPSAAKIGSGDHSATQASTSTSPRSADDRNDSSTAVESSLQGTSVVDWSDPPPLRAFRKKRKQGYPRADLEAAQDRYWSEYDHPEDGEGEGEAYVIYIDPNAKSGFEKMMEKLGQTLAGAFTSQKRSSSARNPLLDESQLPGTPKEDESSSDEEGPLVRPNPKRKSYGTLNTSGGSSFDALGLQDPPRRWLPPQSTALCMVAAAAILIVAYILAATGKKRLAREVDAGVIFAMASSLLFAVVGVAPMLGRQDLRWSAWVLALSLLVADAVCCGGLLAWVLG